MAIQRRAGQRATSASRVRGRHGPLTTTERQSGRSQRFTFCTILGEEVTVLHRVRLGGKRAGLKLGRRKAFEYPVWTVPTPYLILARFQSQEERAKQRGNNRRSLGQVSLFPLRSFTYRHRGGFTQHLGAWQQASRTDSARRGNVTKGILADSLRKSVNHFPVPQHLNPMVHVVFIHHVTGNIARHIAMGRLRDGLVSQILGSCPGHHVLLYLRPAPTVAETCAVEPRVTSIPNR